MTRKVSIDPGSLVITAVRDTSGAVADFKDKEKGHEEAIVDNQQAKELLKGLITEGFEVKIPFSKASFHQTKVESTIGSFKTAF